MILILIVTRNYYLKKIEDGYYFLSINLLNMHTMDDIKSKTKLVI